MNNQLKILILMPYYNRPILVKNALNSILESNNFHQNWILLFGDDGSDIPGKPIVENILGEFKDKIIFFETNNSIEEKLKNGLMLGKYANEIIKNSDADLGIFLCDDDELVPSYLHNLNNFFIQNKNIDYCYSKIYLYNPLFQKSKNINNKIQENKYNQYKTPINPVGKLDASQICWRISCCKEKNAWFNETTKLEDKPYLLDTDFSFFKNLFDICGPCYPTNFFSQFKAIHEYQLLWYKNNTKNFLINYNENLKKFVGDKF